MEIVDYPHLHRLLREHDLIDWGKDLETITRRFLQDNPHGRMPIWLQTLSNMPEVTVDRLDLNNSAVGVTTRQDFDIETVRTELMSLFPWRKGPFHIHGIGIDTEWRSDLKWDRVIDNLSPLQDRRILDIGCGNGYHLWRMLGAGACCAIGVDPMRLFTVQFQAIRHFIGTSLPVSLLPIGIENLPLNQPVFDTVFSMGVLYHRRDPVAHIQQLQSLLTPGGELVLETLIIEQDDKAMLVPQERYASMRNVWNIPSVSQLCAWLDEAGMHNIRIVDVTPTTSEEQRTTTWMPFQSLKDFLDPHDPGKTIEGYPAPVRAVAVAQA